MAGRSIDNFVGLLEKAFRKKEGLKEYLEVVLERVMSARCGDFYGTRFLWQAALKGTGV